MMWAILSSYLREEHYNEENFDQNKERRTIRNRPRSNINIDSVTQHLAHWVHTLLFYYYYKAHVFFSRTLIK